MRLSRPTIIICLGLLAAGCATAPHPPPEEDHTVTVPPNAGIYKVGQPYQIDNVWYYPSEQPDYDETGIAHPGTARPFTATRTAQWRNV